MCKFNEITVLYNGKNPMVISNSVPGAEERMQSSLKLRRQGSIDIACPFFVGIETVVDMSAAVGDESQVLWMMMDWGKASQRLVVCMFIMVVGKTEKAVGKKVCLQNLAH